MGWKLKRVKQCEKCPWKVGTNPFDIPDGYCQTKHAALRSTIADPGNPFMKTSAMACHEHPEGGDAHCVGWLVNQLGPGNNIGLRLQMMNCENADLISLDGEQHESFEKTLPRSGEQ